jgi:hypothetical protein
MFALIGTAGQRFSDAVERQVEQLLASRRQRGCFRRCSAQGAFGPDTGSWKWPSSCLQLEVGL